MARPFFYVQGHRFEIARSAVGHPLRPDRVPVRRVARRRGFQRDLEADDEGGRDGLEPDPVAPIAGGGEAFLGLFGGDLRTIHRCRPRRVQDQGRGVARRGSDRTAHRTQVRAGRREVGLPVRRCCDQGRLAARHRPRGAARRSVAVRGLAMEQRNPQRLPQRPRLPALARRGVHAEPEGQGRPPADDVVTAGDDLRLHLPGLLGRGEVAVATRRRHGRADLPDQETHLMRLAEGQDAAARRRHVCPVPGLRAPQRRRWQSCALPGAQHPLRHPAPHLPAEQERRRQLRGDRAGRRRP